MGKALGYLKKMLAEGDGLPSVRRHAFAASVLNCVGLCWMGLWFDIKADVSAIALGLLAGTVTGVTAGRFAERGEQ
jgi:hypothetical protein